jgi:hypothetical protein
VWQDTATALDAYFVDSGTSIGDYALKLENGAGVVTDYDIPCSADDLFLVEVIAKASTGSQSFTVWYDDDGDESALFSSVPTGYYNHRSYTRGVQHSDGTYKITVSVFADGANSGIIYVDRISVTPAPGFAKRYHTTTQSIATGGALAFNATYLDYGGDSQSYGLQPIRDGVWSVLAQVEVQGVTAGKYIQLEAKTGVYGGSMSTVALGQKHFNDSGSSRTMIATIFVDVSVGAGVDFAMYLNHDVGGSLTVSAGTDPGKPMFFQAREL